MTGEPILGSSLTMLEATVNTEDIDRFDFGTDWWATGVADDFKFRQNWADRHDCSSSTPEAGSSPAPASASGSGRIHIATPMVGPATTSPLLRRERALSGPPRPPQHSATQLRQRHPRLRRVASKGAN